MAVHGLSTNSFLYLCALKTTCSIILVGTLGKCGNTGEYEVHLVGIHMLVLVNFSFLLWINFWVQSRIVSLTNMLE